MVPITLVLSVNCYFPISYLSPPHLLFIHGAFCIFRFFTQANEYIQAKGSRPIVCQGWELDRGEEAGWEKSGE